MANLVQKLGEFTPEQLIAGTTMPLVREGVILEQGTQYKRGDILAVKADGKATIVDITKDDGTQNPYGILADPVDATDTACPGVVYLTGEFNKEALRPNDSLEQLKIPLRSIGIFLKKLV